MAIKLTTTEHIRLWTDFRAGNRDAFDKLYTLFSADLYRYGYNLVRNRQLVEDCMHELFLHIHEHRHRLGHTDNIQFYLYRALRRRLTDSAARMAKYGADVYAFDDANFSLQPYEKSLIDDELADEQKRLLIHQMNRLPKRQKEILYLVYMKGLTYPQTAEVMDITMKSVYNTVNIALTSLRVLLTKSPQRRSMVIGN